MTRTQVIVGRVLVLCRPAVLAIRRRRSHSRSPAGRSVFHFEPRPDRTRPEERLCRRHPVQGRGHHPVRSLRGLVIGMVTGIAAGLAFGMWRPLELIAEPFMAAFNALPRPAIAPLVVLWFGIGLASKILLAWSLVFFLVFYNTYLGVKTIDQDIVNAMRVMRASPLNSFAS